MEEKKKNEIDVEIGKAKAKVSPEALSMHSRMMWAIEHGVSATDVEMLKKFRDAPNRRTRQALLAKYREGIKR